MKNSYLLTLILMTMLTMQYCRPTNKAEKMGDTTTALDYTVAKGSNVADSATGENEIQGLMFIEQATRGCLLEIELGKLAQEKAQNLAVKNFGKLMAEENGQILISLEELSTAKGLKLPVSLSKRELLQVLQIREMEDRFFERLYLKIMLENNRKYIELFQGAGRSPDLSISGFGGKYLPILEKRLQKIMELRKSAS